MTESAGGGNREGSHFGNHPGYSVVNHYSLTNREANLLRFSTVTSNFGQRGTQSIKKQNKCERGFLYPSRKTKESTSHIPYRRKRSCVACCHGHTLRDDAGFIEQICCPFGPVWAFRVIVSGFRRAVFV